MNKLNEQYEILESLKTRKGAFYASASSDYNYTWLRDSFYISLSYADKDCDTYQKAFQAHMDYFRQYEEKLNYHINVRPPQEWYEHMHIRYNADDMTEVGQEWAHVQLDCLGCILWWCADGISRGKQMLRDGKDKEILQKIVMYLSAIEYYNLPSSDFWEENRELRVSGLFAVVAGLEAVSNIVFVPADLITKGYQTIFSIFPNETATREVDSALLSLVYPYRILPKSLAQLIVHNVETKLLRERGCIRYIGDSYYSTLEPQHGRNHPKEFFINTEMEWTMFLPWLSLCHQILGDLDKAKEYIERSESVMTPEGFMPEGYYANSNKCNPNTPLAWSNSLYIQAVEMYEKLTKENKNKSLTQVN